MNNSASSPLISVIMNCFNSDEYLREALDSVLAQTYSNWELIFWDNQSTDESALIFDSYNDKRFNYYRAVEHTVLGKARNLAVKKASGKWIAFLDCDDLWLPDKLHKQVEIIREEDANLGIVYGHMGIFVEGDNNLDTVWGRFMRNYDRNRNKQYLPEGYIFSELLKENFVPLLSSIVRRSAFWHVGGIYPELKQAEDYDLFLKISKDFKVRSLQDILCIYRVHQSNLSNIQLEDDYKESISIVSQYLPSDNAKQGLKSHQNALAVYEIRMGRVFSGLIRILFHGGLLLLMHKIFKQIR